MRAAQRAARDAERRFPVRIRIAVPDRGLGERFNRMQEWLDQNAGADGWAMTPSGIRGVVKDAISIYFADVTIASAFVARWCRAQRIETVDGLFRVRDDEPTPRIGAARCLPHCPADVSPRNRDKGGAPLGWPRVKFRGSAEHHYLSEVTCPQSPLSVPASLVKS
jgi:hypothetical protein